MTVATGLARTVSKGWFAHRRSGKERLLARARWRRGATRPRPPSFDFADPVAGAESDGEVLA